MMKLYKLLSFSASWGRMPWLTDFCWIKRCENCLEMSSAESHSPSTASQLTCGCDFHQRSLFLCFPFTAAPTLPVSFFPCQAMKLGRRNKPCS